MCGEGVCLLAPVIAAGPVAAALARDAAVTECRTAFGWTRAVGVVSACCPLESDTRVAGLACARTVDHREVIQHAGQARGTFLKQPGKCVSATLRRR